MRIDDPNETPTPDTPEVDPVLAAMDEGIAAATEAEAVAEPVAEEAPAEDAQPEGAQPEPVAEPEAPEAAKPEGEQPEPNKAVEDEIAGLNLKDRAAARFRELSADREAMAPLRDAMKDLGLQDARQAAEALARVRDADHVIQRVIETGSNHEQFDKSLQYLALVNKGAEGDMAALQQAWDLIEPELKVLAAALGKEVPGIVDPLAAHPDLVDAVHGGDLTRAHALEVARARQQSATQVAARERAQEATRQQAAQAEAVQQGRQSLNELGAQLSAADPSGYAARFPALKEKLAQIVQQFPPNEWRAQAAIAYATLPAPAPAPAKPNVPAPGHVPLRTTGGRPDVTPTTFDDPFAALEAGINAAR